MSFDFPLNFYLVVEIFEFTGIYVTLSPSTLIEESCAIAKLMISRNDCGFNVNSCAALLGGDDQCSNLTHFTFSMDLLHAFLPSK